MYFVLSVCTLRASHNIELRNGGGVSLAYMTTVDILVTSVCCKVCGIRLLVSVEVCCNFLKQKQFSCTLREMNGNGSNQRNFALCHDRESSISYRQSAI